MKFINNLGFVTSNTDTSLFVFRKEKELYILLYVDDIILIVSSKAPLQHIIDALKSEFSMKDLGIIHHFLGINTYYNKHGMFLSQTSYAKEIIERAHMSDCNPIATPIDVKSRHLANVGERLKNPTSIKA